MIESTRWAPIASPLPDSGDVAPVDAGEPAQRPPDLVEIGSPRHDGRAVLELDAPFEKAALRQNRLCAGRPHPLPWADVHPRRFVAVEVPVQLQRTLAADHRPVLPPGRPG